MGKCQDVDTSGLQKNEQEEQEAALKQEQGMRDYLLEQRRLKDEPLTLSYSFRSAVTQRELPNAVHRASIVVKRGVTAEEVARAVHRDSESLGEKFLPKMISGIREETDAMFVLNATVPEHTQSVTQGSFLIPPTMTLLDLGGVKWIEGAPLFDVRRPPRPGLGAAPAIHGRRRARTPSLRAAPAPPRQRDLTWPPCPV